ncbi:lantibiotic dehydratase [Streptomyces sp. RFCAC02]|uniref:lantibiotic dehydratase n=1 Tax=Streptomyces sp. RFCAC02 TaxID=2499143 RepID=UPI00102211EF|nr:lantibiotic dehydratase [Streptomyces sp. RFCAC02]
MLAWRTVSSSPVMLAFLDSTAPGLAAEVERRLAAGQSWSDKQLRKRAAYLWRLLGRAAAKTTPRGWAGQIAALPVGPGHDGDGRLLPDGTALGALAAVAVENVHRVRARQTAADPCAADPETLIAPVPLRFTEPGASGPGHVRCYVTDPATPERLRQIVLRRTRALDTVLTLLADGPRPLAELEKDMLGALAPDGPPAAARVDALHGFLRHLITRGVLQICQAPRNHYGSWVPEGDITASGALPQPPGGAGQGGWFLDAYRRLAPAAAVSAHAADRVARGLRIAARIAALRDADNPPDTARHERPELAALTDHPRPLAEILAEALSRGTRPPAARRYAGWSPARDPDGGYARLLDHLDAAARSGATGVDIDDALLDSLGAPAADDHLPRWPLDCLLRPLAPPDGSGPVAVLETASPAGVIDARFADGLRALHGGYGNSDAHRAFLAAVEARTGVRFVDLLVPPLTERAANAVRRPPTTGWWTGDPDPTPYYGRTAGDMQYLPLDRITLRRSHGQVIAEADGRRIVPVYCASRSPLPPYDTLVRILLAAGHRAASYVIRLDSLDAAFPGRPRLPRLTAGGDLVIAPATWRIDVERLWRRDDDPLTKVRTLAPLRRAAGLPRHAFVRTAPGGKPVPVDLASLTAVHIIDRLRAGQPGRELLVEEMLPAPGELPLRDPLHGGAAVAAQLVLRLPHDRDAASAAADVPVGGDPRNVPGPPARRPAGAINTR